MTNMTQAQGGYTRAGCSVLGLVCETNQTAGQPKWWDERWYRATPMWAVSSELPVHHCFPSLFHFLLLTLSNTKVQSPGEISQPTVVTECVWRKGGVQERRKRTGAEIVFRPKALNAVLYLKIDSFFSTPALIWSSEMCRSNRKSLLVLYGYTFGYTRKKWKWRENVQEFGRRSQRVWAGLLRGENGL